MKLQTIICFLGAALLAGCAAEEFAPRTNTFYEPVSGTMVNATDQVQLNRLASALAKEKNSITILNDAKVMSFTDSQGEFKAISIQYQSGGMITSMVVPIEEVLNTKESVTNYRVSAESCIMKFSARQEGYQYEVLERCKTVTVAGVGSGTSITFNDNKTVGVGPLQEGVCKISVFR